mgnify:CR=1 FL=1
MTKLNQFTVKDAVEYFKKFGSENDKLYARAFWIELVKLKSQIDTLKRENDFYRQGKLFSSDDKEKRIQESAERLKNQLNETKEYAPLAKRLFLLVQENKVDSQEWKQNLKWNRISQDEALELASKYERENKNKAP